MVRARSLERQANRIAFMAMVCAVMIALFMSLTLNHAYAQDDQLAAGATNALSEQVSDVDMYRVYNGFSGEHFYTASTSERDHLVSLGWKYEGIAWRAPSSSSSPIYRMYSGSDHHYTTSAAERDWLVTQGWRYEGIGWYSDDSKRVAVYRQFNPYVDVYALHNNSGSHNFTTSKEENDGLVRAGWRAEGVAWYAASGGVPYVSNEPTAAQLWAQLKVHQDFRPGLSHGAKGRDKQAFIVLHDTEDPRGAKDVINMWQNDGNGVAAHFIVDRDGSVWQAVGIDQVAWHMGVGDPASVAYYGTSDMNQNAIGIEIAHVKGKEQYTEAQLASLDKLIKYIDTYYGFYSAIIDHKMWRAANPDTSPEFARYFANYRTIRRHA